MHMNLSCLVKQAISMKEKNKKCVDVDPRNLSLILLNQFNFNRGDVSRLALFAKHFGPYVDLFDCELTLKEESTANFDYVNCLRDDATSSLH